MIWYGRLYTFAESQREGSCPPNVCRPAGRKEGINIMSSRITKCLAVAAIVCVLATAFAVPLASAASYSKIYGRTETKVRVRDSASTNATIIDNIVEDACVYVLSSRTSGSSTFVQVKYRSSDGDVETGWVCQSDASETYVKILSAAQAEDAFSVSGGNLPAKRVGTFTDAQRDASQKNSDNTYVKEGTNGSVVKDIQTKLKALGLYSGSITGNVGPKTEQAIRDFQDKYDLTVDGIAGPQTIAKIDAVYSASGSSSSGSSSSGSSSSSSVMKLDSNGTNVRDLQTDLTTLGYYWADITGNFGTKTEAAVKLFQKENGLTQDGVAGKKTLDAIAAAIARKGGTSGSSSSASSSSSGSALKLDSQGAKVTQLQQDLKQLGYYYADITGNFGTKTEAAVKAFQKAYKLDADGVAGTSTLNAIAAAVEKAGGSLSSSSGASGMKLGSTGSDVRALQENLTTLGYYYGDITGHYGTMTQAAVQKFQKARGLTQDGVAGSKTVEAIASAIKSSGGSVADSTVHGVSSSLREGDTGAAVTELQTMLKSLEYYYGEITGHYGSLTKKAVRSFQDDEDLTVDGIAGVNTINRLRKLTGTTSSSSSSSGSAGATVTTASSYGRISKDNVNLRASYSTTSAAKASLDEGEKCRITKKYTVGSETWYYITVSDGKYTHAGYVRSDMIELISENEYGSGADDSASGDNETLGMIRVTGNNVALRNGPGTSYSKSGTASTGDVFYYIDTEDGWFRTKAGYWISRDYAKVMSSDEIDDYVGSGSSSSSGGSGPYKYGSTGSDVLYIQTALKKLGYYNGSLTGHYGNKTTQAVMDFQRDNGLSADGVTGTKTMAAIRDEYNKELSGGSGSSGGSSSGSSSSGVSLHSTVYDLSWDDYKRAYVRAGLSRGNTFKLTDLKTGKTFKVYVQSAGYHADVEPATASDTATMCSIYGVSSASKISYVRRSMIATIGNYQFACSVYGEAHGSEVITNNNYDGQFCVHFRDCKTSGTQVVREENQTPIDQAVTYVKAKGSKVSTTPPSALQ